MNMFKRNTAKIMAVIFSLVLIASVIPMNASAAGASSLSENGYNLIKQFEGCHLTAYKPLESETYYTIGWGHYGSDVKAGQTITQAQADALLVSDMKYYETALNNFSAKYNKPYTQNQYDAIISFSYNNGTGWMTNTSYSIFKYLSGTESSTASQLSDTFTSWCHAGGQVVAGLYNRRQTEVALLLTNDTTKYEVWEATDILNHRKTAALSSENYGTIAKYTKLIITEKVTSDGYTWGRVKYYNGSTSNNGWVNLNYAAKLFSSVDVTAASTATTTAKPFETWVVNTASGLNIRKSADTSSTWLATMPNGTSFDITEKVTSGGYTWGKTTYNGATGWCALNYATYKSGSLTAPTTPTTKPTTAKPTTITTKPTTTTTTTKATTTATTTTKPTTTPTTTKPTTAPTTPTTAKPTVPTTTRVLTYPFENNPKMGDCNFDGVVNSKDVLIMRKYLAGINISLIQENEAQTATGSYIVFERSDINSDSTISTKDLLLLRKHLAGIKAGY